MFQCVVILRKSPYYIMAMDENDAKEICMNYQENVVGIFSSESEISFKQMKKSVEFVAPKIKMIEETIEDEDNVQIFNEIISEP